MQAMAAAAQIANKEACLVQGCHMLQLCQRKHQGCDEQWSSMAPLLQLCASSTHLHQVLPL